MISSLQVAVLREKLEQLGVDADLLIASVGLEQDERIDA